MNGVLLPLAFVKGVRGGGKLLGPAAQAENRALFLPLQKL